MAATGGHGIGKNGSIDGEGWCKAWDAICWRHLIGTLGSRYDRHRILRTRSRHGPSLEKSIAGFSATGFLGIGCRLAPHRDFAW